jgi:hypothetical protein
MDKIPLFQLINIAEERRTSGQQSNALNNTIMSCSQQYNHVLSYPLFYLYLVSMYCAFTHTHSPNSDLKLLWRQFEQNRCRQAVTVQVRSKTPEGREGMRGGECGEKSSENRGDRKFSGWRGKIKIRG